ncbi:18556_t:CDS:2 [Gigaspora margarita]|uniref:18556_t:CDS:1 n=1 Tax=Gigaspora margarita TaxID=4874 RepID=A0ABN7UMM8_GIGMA|nr:18556_t:CDS:2 [Gigaspora margarita]
MADKCFNLNVKIITISKTRKKCNSTSQCSNWTDYSFDNYSEFDVLLILDILNTTYYSFNMY